MQNFELHPVLNKDTFTVGNLPLCQVLLMNNASAPWLILVPRVEGMKEITDLSPTDYGIFWNEVLQVTSLLQELTGADKMNVATLGNMVPQLHLHIVARFEQDPAWPNPIWGNLPEKAYSNEEAKALIATLKEKLSLA